MHNFKNLKIWQKSRIVLKEVFLLTKDFHFEETFNLVSRIMRCAYSIPSNMAERSGRTSNNEFSRFLDIALSSAFELENQLILASDINYISENNLRELKNYYKKFKR